MLHLGNVTFVEPEGQHDASVVPPGSTAEEHMRTACGLLGVEEQVLHAVMTTRKLHTSEGVWTKVWERGMGCGGAAAACGVDHPQAAHQRRCGGASVELWKRRSVGLRVR